VGSVKFANELDADSLRQYAELGFAFRHVAELDYQVEEFLLAVSKHEPGFCTAFSSGFPASFEQRINFIIACYQRYPSLRSFGDATGKSDPNVLGYGLEEIFSFRNAFFHSATTLVSVRPAGYSWDIIRYERQKPSRQSFAKARYTFSSGYLDWIVDLSRYFTQWLVDAARALEGIDVAERDNRVRKINAGHYLTLWDHIWESGELP